MKNTFIAKKSDGSKIDFFEGEVRFKGINADFEAKHFVCPCEGDCTCSDIENMSEIEGWDGLPSAVEG